jgi:imidazolonepropionase-like amidohydrolase
MRVLLLLFCAFSLDLLAQSTFPQNGVYDQREDHYAFINANIYVSPSQYLEKASMVIKKGKVVAVGSNLNLPKDAVVVDLRGKYIYPAFIDLYAQYGLPPAQAAGKPSEQYPQMLSNKQGAYSWNEALKPEYQAAQHFQPETKKADEWRKQGFGLALTHSMDGLARGTGALVFLGDQSAHEMILKPQAAALFSFNKGVSTQGYPSSLMGIIALLRQTYYDALWYAQNTPDREYNISLEQWNNLKSLPSIFECNTRLNILRADKLGDEFGVQYIFKGGGDEYLRLEAIQKTQGSLIIPINFPKAYEVTDPYDAQQVQVEQMQHWELAPSNPARLAQAGIPFALTAHGLEKTEEFLPQLRRAYQAGLKEADLLKALTLTPAQLLKADKEVGSLDVGKYANFFISSGNILSEKASIYETWVKGKAHVHKNQYQADLAGKYQIQIGNQSLALEVKGEDGKWEAELRNPADTSKKIKAALSLENTMLTLSFNLPNADTSDKTPNPYQISALVTAQNWKGRAVLPNGSWVDVLAQIQEKTPSKPLELPKLDTSVQGNITYPHNAYGFLASELPKDGPVLIQNATVWTGEKQGILENTDVLLEKGKIAKIGKNLKAPQGASIVDGKGKHLTAGIIDEHSHIAINAGVNEGTQESSAEVRIGDVINSEDVNIYRQLAGGVTGAQLLHGSANPIGGQSAIIKLRFGQLPEAMKNENAKPFIKFALGENVKQSNWGDRANIRFPQTRMGVEQVYEDYFTRAKEYGERRKKEGDKARRDLDLETVQEIIEGRRFITCHSYVQSEITMLMRVA